MNSQRANRHTIMESTHLADRYGLPLIDWTHIEGLLSEGVSQAPNSGGPDRHTC
jgi:hypothetical protein